ncbi:HNH endonuclease signature motif containing protein [Actinomycetospora sp. NBC_00405]|uniref:HNH endonuclease signature motif containing protein n=1 Tax=Actinomycetospora sp. NBC_00405 TaxID=2975952 RepID=UPI002E208849
MSERGLGVVEREALDRARTRLVALRAEQYRLLEDIAELERLGVAQQTGDRATPRLLQDLSTLDLHEAKRLAEESADLAPRRSLLGEPLPPRLPVTATVYASGEIGPAHVVIIRRTMAHLERLETVSVEDWFAAERVLADDATRLPPRLLARVAARLILAFDSDGAAPPEGEDCRDELHVVRRRDGRLEFKGRLHDPVDGEVFLGAIDPLAEPFGPDDTRSLVRRRIDALKDIVSDSGRPGGLTDDATHPDDAADADADAADEDADEDALIPQPRRPAPVPAQRPGRALVTITMDLRWLQLATGHGTLDTGTPVDPATVRRWACDAEVVPVVLGAKSEPLDVGRLQRTVTDAIRRALNIRDGGCAFPGCDRPPRRCHAHHIRFWGHGGDTRLPNLVLLCRHHHQVIHHGHWTVQIVDGLPWFTPPSWIDPDRQPRPGGRPRVPL